ncbi:uncharacterized protein LOC135837318 isoform X2 [Planococcus citri]|uniref:uncharacterized protein LOC135837318 isoform X2 n=1 Tax=Planococcus citri TaxID=170843 RepID=UPI0031F73C39
MKSYCTMKILLLISFALTAIPSARGSNSSEAHDITTLLNDTIAKTFQNMNTVTINKLVLSIENLKSFHFATYADCELGPFENEFYFTGITVTPLKVESAHLRHDFYRNSMTLFFSYLSIEMKGYLGATPDTAHVGFERSLVFENISIYVIAQPMQSFSEFHPFIIYDSYESTYIYSPWFHENLTTDIQFELERQIKYFLPSLFAFNLRSNEDFMQTLQATYCHHPEEEITSKNYYFIPNITSLHRTLSNITITGMQNFHSDSFAENYGLTVSTLTIKDVRGTTNLHYDGRNLTIFPLYFEVECISITVDRKQQSINVTAHNYTVIETKMNVSLTEYQSKWVMEGIQLAIASSIMPSLKYYRNNTQSTDSLEEHPIVKMITKLSQQFESRTIQKLYDTLNITIPESFKTASSIEIESYNYNISIDAKPTTALKPYPDWIYCTLYNSLEFHFEMPSWRGRINVLNTTHKFDYIDFLMEDTFFILAKRHNSDAFELRPGLIVDVELVSYACNFTSHEQWDIAQETQQLMISLMKNTIITLFAEPLLSLPLDYCTTPVKIFDDFLPFYADHELPFSVPEGRISQKFMKPRISNVIITEWTKSPSALVSIYHSQDLVNGTSENMTTYVNLRLEDVKIRINFNDSLVPFHKLYWTFTSLQIRNYTDSGEVIVDLVSSSKRFPFEMKLESILGDCFNNLTSLIF